MASRRGGLNPKFNVSERIKQYQDYMGKSVSPFGEDENQRRIREIAEDRQENEEYYEDGEDISADLLKVIILKADEYYKGPLYSTRVSWYQFVPVDTVVSKKQFGNPSLVMGNLYVGWVKGTNVSKFGPMSLSDYRAFTTSTSYGQAVVELHKNYGYLYDAGAVGG